MRGRVGLLAVAVIVAAGVTTTASATPKVPTAPMVPVAPEQVADPATGAVRQLPLDSGWIDQVLRTLYPELDEVTHEEQWRFGQMVGLTSHSSAVAQELSSARWLDPRIAALYQRYLGRSPDPTGLAHWSVAAGGALLRLQPADLELVAVGLGASSEAWNAAGANREGFVQATYQAVLGRSADPSGLAHWTARMAAGAGRQTVVRSLLRSTERARGLVADSFVTYLGRAVDPGGAATWIGRYTKAKVGELRLIATLLASSEARGSGCDPLDPRNCLLPFPNDRFTVADGALPTGRRIAARWEWLPKNASGRAPLPMEWNRNDGFSVGQAALLQVPGIDLAQTGAAPITDVGASLDPDAPILVIDAETGERHPVWAELDANAPTAAEQLLVIRPGRNYEAGHRYIVALRNLRTAAGATIEAGSAFRGYRDGQAGDAVGDVEERRPHMEDLFSALGDAGVGRDDLYLAWDFTVASTENTTGRLLHMRDDTLDRLDGSAPAFDVESVTEHPADGVARRVVGTFDVPLYIDNLGAPGGAFTLTTDGLPAFTGSWYHARFDCELPELAEGEQARAVIYGHGLFGSYEEVRSGSQRAMVRDHKMAYCATDWIGMAGPDVATAVQVISNVEYFPRLVDRSQQGILNTIVLGRLLVTQDGFVSDPAFQDPSGDPLVDTSDLFYDGNSQGGVIGGAFVATSPDVSAGVLGVAGMNYSTLLERSVDFDPFFTLLKQSYPSELDRMLGLQFIQMLWDRGETNGYAAHLTDDPLPGTDPHRVLIHTALGDHQVAPFTAEIEARTAGIPIHREIYGSGRTSDVEPGWDLPSIAYPSGGSGLVVWDSGAALAPLANTPPRTGADPHEDPRNDPEAQAQKAAFLQTGGTLIDVCAGAPCIADP